MAGEGFCDEVVGSRDPRGKGDTDVLGKSSLAGEQQMKPLWVEVGGGAAGGWSVMGGGRQAPRSVGLAHPAPSSSGYLPQATCSWALVPSRQGRAPGSCAQPIQGFRNLSNSPHSRNSYDTNLNFHLICSCCLTP